MKLIVFTSSHCAPCKMQKKELEKFLPSHPELRLEMYDADKADKSVLDKYEIVRVPTTVVTDDNGGVLTRFDGMANVASLEAAVRGLHDAQS